MYHCTCQLTLADNHKLWRHGHFTYKHYKPFRIGGEREEERHRLINCVALGKDGDSIK